MDNFLWHSLEVEKIAKIEKVDLEKGLSEEEGKKRKEIFGTNSLPEEKKLSKLTIYFNQFKNPLILILLLAAIITFFSLKDLTDTIAILAVVFLNSFVGFYQENKAFGAIKKLKKMIRQETTVLRDGKLKVIDAKELVPGDLIMLKAGNKVPADGRIIKCQDLKVNEMVLTGEWLSSKKSDAVLPEKTVLAERKNMVYMGTLVEEGTASVLITETGSRTKLGKIATSLKKIKEEKTPYQKKIDQLSKIIAFFILSIIFSFFLFALFTGRPLKEMFLVSIALTVSAIPEGLPIVMTISLALAAERILKEGGLIRKIVAAEVLGSTSVICTDKTGTLTEGKMKIREILGDKFLTLKAAVFSSQAFLENPDDPPENWIFRGSPTEKAFLEEGIKKGIQKKGKKIFEIPFNSKDKLAVAVYEENSQKNLYVAGAPEKILEISKMNEKEKKEWQKKLEEITAKGKRVVASAQKRIDKEEVFYRKLISDLDFKGFLVLEDPVRQEVKKAIEICREAGMNPIIVTGDHKLTALSVAKELKFKIKKDNIIDGEALEKLSDKEFSEALKKIEIYCRLEPEQKTRIVKAWQEKGAVVAMTGDGINDAPAVKKADIGLALASAVDVTKESADLILLNDSFSTIEAAIEEGRRIIDNIRKGITFMTIECFSEVILVAGSVFLGLPLFILPNQILWKNLIEGSPQGIALAFEPKEKDLMKRKPEKPEEPIFNSEMKIIFLTAGILTDIVLFSLALWLYYQNFPLEKIRTFVFVGLALGSFFYLFSCKNLRKNIWEYNIFSNFPLNVSLFWGIVFLLLAVYFPPLQNILKTVVLEPFYWFILIGFGLLNLFLIELVKYFFKKCQK